MTTHLPQVGAHVFRQLDETLFPCTVIDIAYDGQLNPTTWTIQYVDDNNTECISDMNELIFDSSTQATSSFTDICAMITPFLTPWELVTRFNLVCKSYRAVAKSQGVWETIDLSQGMPSRIQAARYANLMVNQCVNHDILGCVPVKSIVLSLTLDSLDLTDHDLWSLLRQMPQLKSLSLVGCRLISFQLFPICQSLQANLCLDIIDLYLTSIQSCSLINLQNKYLHNIQVVPSGLVHFNVSHEIVQQYIVHSWKSHVVFIDKDCFLVDKMCPDSHISQLYDWPFAILPVFVLEAIPSLFIFKSYECSLRFLNGMPHLPTELLQCVADMKRAPTKATPPPKTEDALDAQARIVFASLQEWKTSLEKQVNELSDAVDKAKKEHEAARHEYNTAERKRRQVEKAANRAVLALSMGQSSVAPPRCNIVNKPGDLKLPLLPSGDEIVALAMELELNHFALLDHFLGEPMALALHEALVALHTYGPFEFERGVLAGGKTGRNLRYEMQSVRGDDVLWMDGTEENCPEVIVQSLRQLDRLVLERLAGHNDELRECALMRRKAMFTCYPGEGASYVKHCDNPNQNGRKLTAILYLNPTWKPEDGGELVIHHEHKRTVQPLLDRLLLFYSDARNPHEVLPTAEKRFAMTVWYLDWDEYMESQLFTEDDGRERAKIEREIEKFKTQN
ncbi:hypothetical protein Ae201684P_009685 [Aphanomyces euteiches]|uniref:Fe2OG dioxygenase domain-containing protein n=1 Tax=Aphanomyces euteiches TaxID=100861 RepID=A0A6G0XGM5_9STRA|nr:hypothetical protein Ae201684_004966 [Aphanomyces euteiches]KAH9082359.1 hypothetical protein Ae201684P_009685 [Aphanomyces euteiches]KAH9155317.1 hypothetical protein AeRB84_002712 [Aphanomyces euteiches]